MSNPIYLDFEDDITTVISKVGEAKTDGVSLVVPKRSTLLHSVVNLKLLLKSARENHKNIALITQDPKIESLAANLSVPVAADVKATPSVPKAAEVKSELPSDVVEGEEPEAPPATKTKGPFKKKGLGKKIRSRADKAGQKFKIPNFDRFKKRLLLGGLVLVLLLAGWWYATRVLPTAEVVLKAQIKNTQADFNFIADTAADAVDAEAMVVPADSQEVSKTLTTTFKTTGEKDIGEKAAGQMNVVNETGVERSFPAGTRFTASGKTFLANSAFTVPKAVVDSEGDIQEGKTSVNVTAEQSGDSYNLAPTKYTIKGEDPDKVYGEGAQMSGGTTEIVKAVAQADVDKAKKELLEGERATTKTELAAKFEDDLKVVEDSFTEIASETTAEPAVGGQASEARLVIKVTYIMFGLNTEDLGHLIQHHLEQQAENGDPNEPSNVIEGEAENAVIALKKRNSNSRHTYNLQTKAVLGPDIDLNQLRVDIAELGYSETLDQLKALPGVSDADIRLSPFWVFSLPKDPEKITVRVELPEGLEPTQQ